MAKWKFGFNSKDSGLTTGIHHENGGDLEWKIHQDERPFIDEVKRNRDEGTKQTHMGHKKFATVPDIVAIEILQKYHLDLHAPEFMHNPANMTKLKKIIMTDYPYLVVNKA